MPTHGTALGLFTSALGATQWQGFRHVALPLSELSVVGIGMP